MSKLSIELKQHTPLIHFQHGQEGATLRATEVKPKLDRFILTRLGRSREYENEGRAYYRDKVVKTVQDKPASGFDSLPVADRGRYKAASQQWLIGSGEQKALNYKMRIEANGKREEFLIASFLNTKELKETPEQVTIISQSPYFAQEKENNLIVRKDDSYTKIFLTEPWDNLKMKGIMHEKITLEIFSLNDELIREIKENIEAFFACHNFGTRQNKGFGSFTVKRINNGKEINRTDYDSLIAAEYDFTYKKTNRRSASQWVNEKMDFDPWLFSQIKSDYQLLKSGLNFPNKPESYKKSLLFCYCVTRLDGNPRWEKRKFKQWLQPYKLNGHRVVQDLNGPLSRSNCRLKGESPLNDEEGNRDWLPDPAFNYSFIRALLGMAEQYEFLCTPIPGREKEYPEKKESKYTLKASVKVKSEEIERFQSPLLFKVISDTVYLAGNEIDPRILGKTFHFDFELQKKPKGKIPAPEPIDLSKFIPATESRTLKVPAEFSLINFMKYALNYSENGKKILHYQLVKSKKQ